MLAGVHTLFSRPSVASEDDPSFGDVVLEFFESVSPPTEGSAADGDAQEQDAEVESDEPGIVPEPLKEQPPAVSPSDEPAAPTLAKTETQAAEEMALRLPERTTSTDADAEKQKFKRRRGRFGELIEVKYPKQMNTNDSCLYNHT